MSDLGRQLVRLQVHKLHGLIALLLVFWCCGCHVECGTRFHTVVYLLAVCEVLFTRIRGCLFHELLTLVAKHG